MWYGIAAAVFTVLLTVFTALQIRKRKNSPQPFFGKSGEIILWVFMQAAVHGFIIIFLYTASVGNETATGWAFLFMSIFLALVVLMAIGTSLFKIVFYEEELFYRAAFFKKYIYKYTDITYVNFFARGAFPMVRLHFGNRKIVYHANDRFMQVLKEKNLISENNNLYNHPNNL